MPSCSRNEGQIGTAATDPATAAGVSGDHVLTGHLPLSSRPPSPPPHAVIPAPTDRTAQNPSHHPTAPSSSPFPTFPRMLLASLFSRNPSLRFLPAAVRAARAAMSASPPAELAPRAAVTVEYAKSARSACKGCSAAIAKGALRLGAHARDPRAGYDTTKWYHVACFPASSHPLGPLDKLPGFLWIKESERDELRALAKNNESDGTELGPSEEPSAKKAKADPSSPEAAVADKGTVSVEYAKSARSTCKGCNVSIAKGAVRLGVAAHDPRGWDSTKWYHVACFPASSHPLGPVEMLSGFDSIKDEDRVELQELEKNNKRDQAAVGPLEGPSPSKANPEVEVAEKSSPGNKGVGTVIPFSASHVKKEYKDATLPAHWKAFETVIFREQDDGLRASAKIAAFDFDGCLAKTSVKITGADKWSLQHKSIPSKLQSLYNDGYKLVIFTNESNIDRWKNKRQQAVDSKVGRLDNFIECVKVPIQVFIACGVGKGKGTPDDRFRKPNSGMWWLMAEHFNSGIAIDMDQSFYVGDAAGRENDHSDADIKFAKDIGLKFHVPEEFFGP
ncbi:polynucleotide 3'-phosphatase ZDP isoform X3 [Lolium perenne]|uniref:polynucleotide 3'-phosphatase ZDP isoform X3 n=1 Tax=Lolium perenne TaxID=4522 RepID=UPI0021F60BCF|nr:polynucleotide 3'-phosphatase ZDP-like isoform X7 [Lolium perenne]